MKHKEAYGYLRVSTKGQAKEGKHGFKRQKESIVVGVYVPSSTSMGFLKSV